MPFSHLSWAVAMPNENAAIVADAFYNHLICHFGSPEYLLSDRGPTFTGDVIQLLCNKLDIKNIFTSAYHPQ